MYRFTNLNACTSHGSLSKPNEDGYLSTDTRFVVMDGATGRAKNGHRFMPQSGYDSDAAWLVGVSLDL